MTTLKWGTQQTINTSLTGAQDDASVAAFANGDFMAVWIDHSGAHSVLRSQRFNADGTKDGAETAVFSNSSSDFLEPDIITLSDGSYVISARHSTGHIDFTHVNAAGAASASFDMGSGSLPAMAELTALAGGGYAVSYESGANKDIKLRIFDSADNQVGGEIAVNATSAFPGAFSNNYTTVAQLSGGNVVVAWNGLNNAVNYRVFSASGTPLTGEMTANGDGYELALIPVGAGFMMAWDDVSNSSAGMSPLRGRLYGANGAASGLEFTVGDTLVDTFQGWPELLALRDGRVMAAWVEVGQVRGRVFNPSTGVGEASFDISTSGFSSKWDSVNNNISLALMSDGRVAVTWSDADSGDAAMQIIDPRNGVVNGSDATSDILYGHDLANDTISGKLGSDTLYGLGGNDILQGGFDSDTLYGGNGDDFLYANTQAKPTGSIIGDNLYGGADKDSLFGSNGADMLDGGTGKDQLYGYGGVDQLYGGDDADYLSGGSEDDYMSGGGGKDVFFGGAGQDTMVGGLGDDEFYVQAGDGGDVIVEYAGEGNDRIFSEISYTLATNSEIETLSTNANSGTANINLTGSDLANSIIGNNGSNILDGRGGSDVLYGLGGADYFTFSTAPNGGNVDVIADFVSADDLFFLDDAAFSGMAAGFLSANGFLSAAGATAALTAAQRVIHNSTTGDLYYDADGIGGAAAVRFATIGAGHDVFSYDFFGV